MINETPRLAKSILLSACLAFSFTSASSLGCGSESSSPSVDSQLFGIYRIQSYKLGEENCDAPPDATPPGDYIALYSYAPDDDPDEPVLAAQFCDGVEDCRTRVRDFPGFLTPGYSFIMGSDETGWLGWGISSTGSVGDQCLAEVQQHVLTVPEGATINIDTETVENVFAPATEGNLATCSNRDAINSIPEDAPCLSTILLDATYDASL